MDITGIVKRGLCRVPSVQVLKLKQSHFRDNDYESRRVGLGTTVEYIERKFKTKA